MKQPIPSIPLVSIIISTYNRPIYLKQTLESVVRQTYTNMEIIVVDDGSLNDDTLKVCENFKTVTYVKIENSGGPAKPRNVGIKKAKGKYIAFLDDDDLWIETKIEQQVTILEEHTDFGLVHGYCQVIDENGKLTGKIVGKAGSAEVKHGDVSLRMIGNWTLMTSSVLLRKGVINLAGCFNEKMPPAGEDVEFWVRCSFFTRFYYLNSPLVYYRTHQHNISKLNPNYVQLPLYLKQVLKFQKNEDNITSKDYKKLLNNLCKLQIKRLKLNKYKAIRNLFILNKFWFLKFDNYKFFIKKCFIN